MKKTFKSYLFNTFWNFQYLLSKQIAKKILLKLKPITYLNKKRYGSNEDGGYVIDPSTFHVTDNEVTVLSFGVGEDISFEERLLSEHSNIRIYCFDPYSIMDVKNSERISFYKIGLTGKIDKGKIELLTLNDIINTYSIDINNAFLKIDIEGYEWSFINNIETSILEKFNQIAIEIHFRPCDTIFDKLFFKRTLKKRLNALEKISERFELINIHANNSADYRFLGDFIFPECLELTYINKNALGEHNANSEYNKCSVLNYPTLSGKIDIQYPFFIN